MTLEEALHLAGEHYRAERLVEAENVYRQILATYPDQHAIYNILGVISLRADRIAQAGLLFEKAIAADPESVSALSNLGKILTDTGRLKEAIGHCRKAIEIDPGFLPAQYNLANALQESGQLEKAVEHYHKALEINPAFADAHLNLGVTLQKLGQLEEAIKCLKDADPGTSEPKTSAILLECYYRNQDHHGFEHQLTLISKNQRFNFRAASASAFASHQWGTSNSYKCCDNPIELIATYDLLDAGDVSPDLILEIGKAARNNRNRERFAPGHISKGYKSYGNLFTEKSSVARHLEKIIRRYVGVFLKQHNNKRGLLLQNWPTEYELDGWYIRMLSNGHITAHVHEGWLSGVFYVSVPAEKKHNAGDIEFTLHGYDPPVLREDFPRRAVTTKTGRLILFPSSLPHRVFPFSGPEERISMSFDIVPKHQS